MDDENETPTAPRRGGGLGALIHGTHGRLLLIGGGLIAAFVLVKHFSATVPPVSSATTGASTDTSGGSTGSGDGYVTIYEPTVQTGGSGSSGSSASSGNPVPLVDGGGVGQKTVPTVGLSFSQWLYQFKSKGGASSAGGAAANLHNISIDPQLTASQQLQLEDMFGGGAGHGPAHPAGTALQRIAPVTGLPLP